MEIDRHHELLCHVQRSIRYHRLRERFFAQWSRFISLLTLVSGSAVVATILSNLPDWASLAAGVTIVVLQAIQLIWGLDQKARLHSDLASEFVGIEREIARQGELSNEQIKELNSEILRIEAREPPIKRYLDLICHNQVARSIGSNDVERLKWWQRMFAQYLNGDTALQ